jgi:hypothetical protein
MPTRDPTPPPASGRPVARRGGRLLALLLAAGVGLGCGPRPGSARAGTVREVLVADGPPVAHLDLLACTYGGPRRLGRHDPAKIPARVVAVVELEAEVPLRGVTVAALEVFDGSGTRLGYGLLPATLRRAPRYRPPAEPLDADTVDFDGTVTPGRPVRLWIEAALDVPLQQLLDVSPARVEAILDVGGGQQLRVAGRVGTLWTG